MDRDRFEGQLNLFELSEREARERLAIISAVSRPKFSAVFSLCCTSRVCYEYFFHCGQVRLLWVSVAHTICLFVKKYIQTQKLLQQTQQ